MNLQAYIESGIIESYLLGLANEEEVAVLERMRGIYPELESEISAMEYKLQRASMAGGIEPPAVVWDRIVTDLQSHTRGKSAEHKEPPPREGADFTYILQPRNNTITVSIWWRCAFIALCMLVMALVASTVYFYSKYQQLEEKVLHIYQPAQTAPRPPVK